MSLQIADFIDCFGRFIGWVEFKNIFALEVGIAIRRKNPLSSYCLKSSTTFRSLSLIACCLFNIWSLKSCAKFRLDN